MIEHLQGRENALEPLGWTGRKAEWIALACLHGEGVFTRAQLCFHLQMNRWQALRFVRALVSKGFAAEDSLQDWKVCRIFSWRIHRALGTEEIRHRRVVSTEILLRRLLALDYVLEHSGLPWLPTESEKVRAFKALGDPVSMRVRRLMPALECENDMRGRFTKRPLGNSQCRFHLSSVFSSVCALLAGPTTPARNSPRRTGATPLFECLVRAWHGASFHTHPAAPRGVAPV